MCEPVSMSTMIAISVASMAMSAGMGVMSAMQKDKAQKAQYASKVQAQNEAWRQAQADRDASHQSDIAERAAAEREFSSKQLESTLEAEELRGKALAQGANSSVASSVFDQQDRHIFMADANNQTSNIWNLQNNARNLKARGEGAFRKQNSRMWQNRAGLPPTSTLGMDIASSAIGAIGSGISLAGGMQSAGMVKPA
jgi:hypothetical protein